MLRSVEVRVMVEVPERQAETVEETVRLLLRLNYGRLLVEQVSR